MLSLLLVLLVILIIISYFLNGFDVLSAWLIACSMFFISVLIAFLNQRLWGMNFAFKTFAIILLALICWGVGDCIGKIRLSRQTYFIKNDPANLDKREPIVITRKAVYFIATVMFITTAVYFIYLYKISLIAGNPNGIIGVFKYARYAVINVKYNVSEPYVLAQLLNLSEAFGYVFIFIIIYNKIMVNFSTNYYYYPVILFLIQTGISTARINFIHIITTILLLVFILWKKKRGWDNSVDLKIMRYAVLGLFTFLILFRLLGYLTDKSGNRQLWNDISVYMGSSIFGLDYFLKNPHTNPFFGRETLYNLYPALTKLGLTNIPAYNSTLDFFYFSGSRSNIYTAIRRLIQDYGVSGMAIIFTVQGFFFSKWLNIIKYHRVKGFTILLFTMFMYIVVELAIDEQFVVNLVSINTFYKIIFTLIVYKVLIKREARVTL